MINAYEEIVFLLGQEEFIYKDFTIKCESGKSLKVEIKSWLKDNEGNKTLIEGNPVLISQTYLVKQILTLKNKVFIELVKE